MRFIILFFWMVFTPLFLAAQTMDDSAIQNLQSGEYKLAEGKLQISFEQGVSEEEMRAEVTRLGYEVESAVFENYVIHVDNRIDDDQLIEIEGLAVVDSVHDHRRQYDANLENKIKESRMMSDAERNELLEQLAEQKQAPSGLVLVFLNADATESTVEEIRSQFENLEISILKPAQRTAIIKTEIGKELEAMDELNAHSFVENSAFVGVID